MPLPAGNFAQARVYYTGSNAKSPQQIIFWFADVGGAPSIDALETANALATHLDTIIASDMLPYWCSEIFYLGVAVAYHRGGVVYNGRSTANSGAGGDTNPPIPEFVAAVIEKRTTHPGRSGSGRWYLTGFATNGFDGEVLAPGVSTWVSTFFNNANANATLSGVQFEGRHFSRKLGQLYAIEHILVNHFGGTQRRRLLQVPL